MISPVLDGLIVSYSLLGPISTMLSASMVKQSASVFSFGNSLAKATALTTSGLTSTPSAVKNRTLGMLFLTFSLMERFSDGG